MAEFISEDDLKTFEGWMRYQGVDPRTTAPEEQETWHQMFKEVRERCAAAPKVGLMKLQPVPGEHRYALAVREGSDLWLTLWVRRSRKGEFFVMLPTSNREWDPHTSYHLDGTLHMKSYGRKFPTSTKHQPLTGVFRGIEDLGTYTGHSPKSVGAICDPTAFSGIVEVPPGVRGPQDGMVTINLLEPGLESLAAFPDTEIVRRRVFPDVIPWVMITVHR